ncbi:MAG: type II secretion system F family protein [Pseudomonadota bacterium]|nr:type II secretion system F family protein [Pseudomonadota bacterium]MDE3038846.1 type II secretion system F family protein [Pseudomonadota bacterium]
MTSFNYTAVNDMGRRVRGVVAADNELDLEARLKQIGLDLIAAREVRVKKSSGSSRIRLKDIIILCMHLEQLDRAGVPLHDALADVRDSSESVKLRDVLTGVYESVKNGEILSRALAAYPRVFNDVFIGLITAGEKTGNLSVSFAHLAEHLKWTAEIRRKVKKATRYPLVLLLVISAVITTLMVFVVPKLVDFIISQGFSLPWHTRALIATSYAFQHYWYLILGLPVIFFAGINVFYRMSDLFAYRMDAFILKWPLIGPVIRKIDMARFTHFFSVMFNSGIDMLDSLEAAKGVVSNRVLKESVALVKTNVTEGSSLTSSLRLSNQFPTLVIRMFKVGEDSGNMSEALENINFFYTREVNDAVEAMTGAIQPILTVVMGVLIFWVIAAVFGPLYDSFSKMKF